ncbi:Uncharacterised protein (plasmid) [Tsukamurella tyrosinosolvens]|uniref:Uncharacterized protein n=1 Tax=Tsukamurella tyrosinosolvens TaxID=57704 RepID=A0A1H4NML6_TSUTY|nr:hypothetical protein [Tsukamurella tyrosinosolvens]SEB95802.1 hypothetical protein SAMN04489793_1198 [Tsukamurella tyrosinosolvens]VEI00171.1 Uncharacterised protein [Tsukamurella tyrosinosolvens]
MPDQGAIRTVHRAPLVIATLAALLLAGCATTVDGTATAPASISSSSPIPSGLDTGDFPTEPATVLQGDGDTAWITEGSRMLAAIVLPSDVDPALVAEVAGQEAAPALTTSDVTSVPDALRSPLTRMKVGVALSRADRPQGAEKELRIGLYRFDDSSIARQVLDSEAFEQRPLPRVTLAGVGEGAAAETTPGTVDAFVAFGPLVVHIHARAKDTASAAVLAERAVARQMPVLRVFTPTPVERIGALPVDEPGVLRRTVWMTGAPDVAIRWIGAMTMPMYERRVGDPAGVEKLRAAGVDAVGWNIGRLYRARDEAAARGLRPDPSRNPAITAVGGVPQLGDAVACYSQQAGDPFCDVVVGRYFARIPAGSLTFAREAAAAQWVILTRNP